MSDIVKDSSVGNRATLSRHGKNYALIGERETPKKPAGTYICIECGDARITFHTPQDEYKTKCPKCGAQMVRATKPLMV